jgi:hypothetical protein
MADRPSYRGVFINLDRSVYRRARMEARLRKFNLQERYSRFPAVDGQMIAGVKDLAKSGDFATFQSHYLALAGTSQFRQTIHVMEDDADFIPQLEQIICSLDAHGRLDPFDIVFTETAVGLNVTNLRKYKRLFDAYQRSQHPELGLLGFNEEYLWGASSYLVPAQAVEKVASVLRAGVEAGNDLPIDLFIRNQAQAGRLRLGCIFPFITGVAPDDVRNTTMPGRSESHTNAMEIVSLLNYSFFLGRDFTNLPHALLEKLRSNDEHQRLIASVLGFVVCSADFPAD